MEFSLMTEPQLGGGYDQLSWAARYAEEAGLFGFARSDHFYWRSGDPRPATEAFTSLGGIARETTRVRLAVLVSPITFRHPAVIAKASATLDQMSGGRFDLGLGTGWMDEEHQAFGMDFPDWKERFARLDEALAYVRSAFAGKTFQGRFYELEGEALPRPTSVRMIVGGSGPEKTPALAGRYADEYNHFVTSPENLRPKWRKVEEAAQAHGRDPETITFSVMGPAVLAANQSELEQALAEAANFRSISVEQLKERWDQSRVPYGTVGEVSEALGGLSEVGVSRYYLQWLHLDDGEGLASMVDLAAKL